jgi:dienelactone hydrolase
VLQGQFSLHQAVGDDVFEVYRSVYSYDRQPLEARVERVEETRYWRQENVSVAAAYGKERVLVRLLLPKNAVPPYQTVIWFPGSYALNLRSSDPFTVPFYFDFLVQSGRAVIYPIYQGTYERRLAAPAALRSSAHRDMVIQWSKDLGRTIDYLETRSDIDSEQLAYYVLSMVGQTLPLPALEQRLKVLVLVSGGLLPISFPSEVDPINFAPRIKVPVLLLGGRYDYQSPVEDSQVPLFNLFGTPAADKSHVIVDSGHVPERGVLIREILEWLDRYLGPVKVKAG